MWESLYLKSDGKFACHIYIYKDVCGSLFISKIMANSLATYIYMYTHVCWSLSVSKVMANSLATYIYIYIYKYVCGSLSISLVMANSLITYVSLHICKFIRMCVWESFYLIRVGKFSCQMYIYMRRCAGVFLSHSLWQIRLPNTYIYIRMCVGFSLYIYTLYIYVYFASEFAMTSKGKGAKECV